jgi:deoxyribonuclease-1
MYGIKLINKSVLIGLLTFATLSSFAKETYYGKQFFQAWPAEEVTFAELHSPETFFNIDSKNSLFTTLRTLVHKILSGGHIINRNDFDTIVEDCDVSSNPNCIQHRALEYKVARTEMFGNVFLEQSPDRSYKIKSVYCNKYYSENDFPANHGPGPGLIPHHSILNAEHTWPQSRFTDQDKDYQKSDLNILFPVESNVNSTRSNHPFGEVTVVTSEPCPGARLGKHADSGNALIFEPPNSHKGNAARAMFYFAVRYGTSIDPVQEKILRRWHKADPVDAMERARHEAVFEIQHVRNPFIDFPELADKFSDF